MGHQISDRLGSSTQVVLLNGFNRGANKRLSPSLVRRMKQTGTMTLLESALATRFWTRAVRRRPALVHRVDGVPELARGRRTEADEIQPAVNRLADFTIFQSEYCRSSFAEQCGFLPDHSTIVYNGVDPRIFFPSQVETATGRSLKLVAASWSANRRKGFDTLAEIAKIPGVELTFAGNWCPDVEPANVKLAGVLQSNELAALMRSSDAMVHAALNEPCSNAIVEAMACGLPVLFRDSGGNRELVGEFGVPIGEDLKVVIDVLRLDLPQLRRALGVNQERFYIQHTAKEYVCAFREAVKFQTTPEDVRLN